MTQAQSGSALSPNVAIGPAPGISLTVRPDLTGPISVTGNPAQWFANKSVLVSPCVAGVCHPGTLGRDAIIGPDLVNTDFSGGTQRVQMNYRHA